MKKLRKILNEFWKEEEAVGVVEIILILARAYWPGNYF